MRKLSSAAVLVAVAALTVPVAAEVLEQVLVKVNGDIISKTEFEARQVAALRSRPEFANVTSGSLELQKAVAEATPNLILEAVDDLLLIQRGRELNYSLSDAQFNQAVASIKESNNLQDDARFQEALKQEGLTMADLRRNMERRMLITQVQRTDLMAKMSVTDEEAQTYYNAHRQEFTTPSELTLREILIEVPTSDRGVNVAQDDELRTKAEDIRKRLLAGEPFPRLAADESAAASKANGGLIGPIQSEELAPQLATVLEKLKIGDITEVMPTQRGHQILKLESRTDTRIRTFEDARGAIGEKVMEQKLEGELVKYLDRLRAQATITWRNDELKRAYEQGLSKRHASAAQAAAAPAAK